jgi:hypothetical protein
MEFLTLRSLSKYKVMAIRAVIASPLVARVDGGAEDVIQHHFAATSVSCTDWKHVLTPRYLRQPVETTA